LAQFSADPGNTLGLGFGAVYAIRPVKPSFLPVQPCAKMTAVVPAGVIGRMGPWNAPCSLVFCLDNLLAIRAGDRHLKACSRSSLALGLSGAHRGQIERRSAAIGHWGD
jgi:hypothetical protein